MIRALLSSLAVAFACTSVLAAAPVRVATNPEYGGVAIGNRLLYPGSSNSEGVELWTTDGTAAGTKLLKDLRPGPDSSYPGDFTVVGGVVFFLANVSDTTYALWRSDGTTAGTIKLADFAGLPNFLTAAGNAVYFDVLQFDQWAVWTSDGTVAGTQEVRGGFPQPATDFTAAVGKVFFSVEDSTHGEQLWSTTGSFEGTQRVKDINPGNDDALVFELRAANGMLLFGTTGPSATGLNLWRSDGTSAGTQPVGMAPISGDVGPVLGNAILLTAQDGAGLELWRSDGTAAGSYRLGDLLPGGSSRPRDFAAHDGIAYFSAAFQTSGQTTLFRSDGTPAGTARMTATLPASATKHLALGGAGNEIFFLVKEGETFRSLWGADRNLTVARKRFELTSLNDAFIGYQLVPGGIYLSVERMTAGNRTTELWFIAAENPAGNSSADSDTDGVPDGVEPTVGLNATVKDNDVFTQARLFAMQQYRDFLGREGDAAGIDYHTRSIDSGSSTRVSVIEQFMGSPEFAEGLPQCTRLYFSFFMRIPDYAGLMFQAQQYRSGVPLEVISQNFSNSPEFTNRYGTLTDGQYVDLVYQNVLGRAPDAAGRQYYLDRLSDGRLTRGSIMVGFSESPEFKQIVDNEVYVTEVYVGMLRRTPDQAGLDFYVNQIEGGAPRNSIIGAFIASPEYRARFLP